MVSKRHWYSWPKRFSEQLNGVSGIAGAGGTIMSLGSWTLLSGGVALGLTGTGLFIAASSFAYAAWKAFPPILIRPEDLVGKTIQVSDLNNIYPKIRKLSIIGPSRAGKTTLQHRLSFEVRPNYRTQSVTAKIVAIPTTPPTYLAILDGGGERYAQQFRIVEPADYLCIVIDHNISNDDFTLSRERLRDINEFLNQVRHHLIEIKAPRKRWIEILVNKRDLWQNDNVNNKTDFEEFWNEQTQKWSSGNFADVVMVHSHSNEIPDDITRFMNSLQHAVIHN